MRALQKYLRSIDNSETLSQGDKVHVHQNASVNHVYNQIIWALLSSVVIKETLKETLPVSTHYMIPTIAFLVKETT